MTEPTPGRGEQHWTELETLAAGSEPRPRRRYGRAAGLVAGGALVGAVIAGSVPAIAGSTASPSPSASGGQSAGGDRPGGHARGAEKVLTGTTADKVRAAALAKVPGATVDRLETDADGATYEAHLTKADGTHVTVKLDKNFTVTGVETHQGGDRPQPGASA
jgi:hypothetical protein